MTVGCSVCGTQKIHAKGMCCRHYKRAKYAAWTLINPGKQRERVASWRAANRETAREIDRRSHVANKVKRNADSRLYRTQHADHMRELGRAWSKANPDKWKVTNAERRASKVRGIPSWARCELDEFIVSEMYQLATMRTKATGIKWHVDHIVPLRNRNVCGLHCAANLRVIPAMENHIKGNRVWPDMWTQTPTP